MAAERKVGITLILRDKLSKSLIKAEAASSKLGTKLKAIGNRKVDMKKLSLGVAAVGVAAVAAAAGVFKLVQGVAAAGDKIFFMTQKLGLSAESLSRFQFLAKQSGTTLQALQTGMKTLANNAVMNSAEFKRWGVSLKDVNGNTKDANTLFREAAQVIAEQENSTLKAAAAQQLMGRSGIELIPLLNLGADGMAKLEAKADRLGITMTSAGAALSNEFNNQLGATQDAMAGVTRDIGEKLMPGFIRFFKVIQSDGEAFATTFKTIMGNIGTVLGWGLDAFGVFAKGAISILGLFELSFGAAIIALNAPMGAFIGTINLAIAGMNKLLPASRQLTPVANSFADTIDNTREAMALSAETTGDQINAIDKMVVSLQNTDKMVFKSTQTTRASAQADKEKKLTVEELAEAEKKRLAIVTALDERVKSGTLAIEQSNHERRIELAQKEHDMRVAHNAEIAAWREEQMAKALSLSNAMVKGAQSVGRAFVAGYQNAVEGQDKLTAAVLAGGAAMLVTVLNLMEQVVLAAAVKAAAEAYAAHQFLPFVGIAVGAAAASLAFAGVKGLLSNSPKGFAQGGLVSGGVANRDSVPAMLTPGEFVLTKQQTDTLRQGGGEGGLGGGGGVNIQINTATPPNRAEMKKYIRQSLLPAMNELKAQGMGF